MWLVFPAGDASKHANMSDYGTYCPTVGNSTIIIDQIGTIGRIQVMPNSIDTFPGLSRACNVDKDHIPIGAKIVIATINSEGYNERRRIVQYDLSKIKEKGVPMHLERSSEISLCLVLKLKTHPIVT